MWYKVEEDRGRERVYGSPPFPSTPTPPPRETWITRKMANDECRRGNDDEWITTECDMHQWQRIYFPLENRM